MNPSLRAQACTPALAAHVWRSHTRMRTLIRGCGGWRRLVRVRSCMRRVGWVRGAAQLLVVSSDSGRPLAVAVQLQSLGWSGPYQNYLAAAVRLRP
jgi:hypothetical protein